MGIPMEATTTRRIGAGLSLLFMPGQRPSLSELRNALEVCQIQAALVGADEGAGSAEIIASGLMFEIDGLSPDGRSPTGSPQDYYGFEGKAEFDGLEAVRLYPGHHLSGGITLEPVVRAVLALAAELAVALPVQAVHWYPANTAIEPRAFSRSVLAWLVGGAFPAFGLTALSALSDGTVVSRGLAHFVGQELTLRGGPDAERLKLAGQVVDQIVRTGPLQSYTQWRLHDLVLCAEPAREAQRIYVWPAEVSV